MKRKYLIALDTGQAGHLISEQPPRPGRMATIFVDNDDGTRKRYSGTVKQILATMPLSRRERLIESRELLNLNDDQLGRLIGIEPRILDQWYSGKAPMTNPAARLMQVAVWLHDDHPECWREWRQRIERQRPSDGDDE